MSAFELREIPEADLDQYYDIRAQAFGRPESEREVWRARVSDDTEALRLGAYRGTDLVGGLRVLPGGQWLDGHRVGMGGVAAVVVRPEARGQGIARELLDTSLTWMRDHDLVVSALHPATTKAYRAAGWELAGDQAIYAVPTRSLAGLRTDTTRTVERLGTDANAEIRECYARYAATQHGFVDRSPSFWRLRESVGDEDGGFTYGVRVGAAIVGYVRYQQALNPTGWGYGLRVDDFVAPDPDTAAALWRFLGGHSMQVEMIEVPAAVVDHLLVVLDEQDIRQIVINRWMHRLVDLPRALAARGTRFPGSATLRLAVEDPWSGAGGSAWTLTADGGTLRAEPADHGMLATDIGALSAISIGRFSPRFLATTGRLSGPDEQVELLGKILAAPRPDLTDDF